MYKTIYRFSVRVEEKSFSFPLHLCIYQNKVPRFEELLDKIRQTVSHQGISMNDYYVTLENTRHHGGAILHDDQSLQVALKQMSDRHYLELALQRKRARTLSPPAYLPRRESMPVHPSSPTPSISSPFRDIPVIKPTVLRWSPDHYAGSRRSSSISTCSSMTSANKRKSSMAMMMDIDTDASSCSIRKDSGISLDNDDDDESDMDETRPMAKKQRSASADHQLMTRKLPDLPLTPHNQHRSSLFETSSAASLPTIVHPLDFRRPSTAPPSPQPLQPGNSLGSNPPITLPAITSLTAHDNNSINDNNSNTHDTHTQLAPIHRQFSYDAAVIRSPPQTPCSPANTASSTSSGFAPAAASSTGTSRRASSVARTSLHRRVSDALSPRTPGQFLCEHAMDDASGRICGQTFRRSYDLSRHQSIHMKNRPFCYCSQCGKKFTRMDALRRHERVQGHAAKRYNRHHHPSTSAPTVHPQQARV